MLRVLTLVAVLALGCGRTHFDDHPIGGAERDGALAVDGITPRPEPAAGCVLHYAMDEDSWTGDVVDSCGLHPAKALAGAAPIDDPQRGRVGGFTGGTSCVTTPDTSDLHMASGLTISAWIKPTSVPPGSPDSYGVVSKRISFGAASEYSVWINADSTATKDQITVDIDTENDRFADPNVDYLAAWHQITVVYDGTLGAAARTKWYADGALSFEHTESSTTIAPASPEPDLWVGCLPFDNGAAQSMVGSIDEVVIWNRALAAAEVASWHTDTAK